MATKPPTFQDIVALADRRTAELGYPADPPTDGRNLDLWREQRDALRDRQIENAKIELTRRYERERDREQQAQARDQAAADAREADLRRRFDLRFPGGSDRDFEALRPALLAELSAEAAAVERDALDLVRSRIRI